MNISSLSLEEKIGQRFIFGINNNNIEPIIELIKNGFIGGIILYKKNYHNYDEMIEVINRFKAANKDNKIPLFIAIDQEGGVVNRFPSEIHNLKNIYDVSKHDANLIGDYADILGELLIKSGINMNLAPVVDIYNNSKSKALYKRCFYGDSKQIFDSAKEYIDKANDQGIISVIKHYPGHGASKFDSHYIIPCVYDYQDVLDKHMKPFDELIKKKIDALMVGHLVVRKLTGILPASISNNFLRKYLRDNGYEGLILSDEVNMLRRHLLYRFIYLDKALRSLCDIVLVKIKDVDEGYNVIDKYKKLLLKDKILEKNLNDSVTRIIDVKKKYDISDDLNFKDINLHDINLKIDRINNLVK